MQQRITPQCKKRSRISLDQKLEEFGTQPIDDQSEAVDAGMLRDEEIGLVHNALDELSGDHRAILVLREMDDLAYEEIAQVLSVSVGTVRTRLSHARERFKEAIEVIQDSVTMASQAAAKQ